MKKKLSIVILLAIVAAMILPVTFAWFSDKSTSDIGITSYVHKSYFESGDGSSDEQYAGNEEELGYDDDGCAYEIKYPVQFYYFSWLQYLGYFNQAVTETTTINQKYFYLSDDLDMTGWVLPPVGTAEFPFLGHFDGNGHTISNLTVQNVVSTNLVSTTTLSDVPETIGTVEVVGLFGVVGSTENDGTVKAAVENEGLFTPSDDDYTYNHANNVIKNFTLTDVTLKADAATHNALIGAVAGYLNATVAHADVTAATLCVANGTSSAMSKTNISDYSVIGYNAQAPSASATAYIELAAPTIDNTNTIATAISGGGGSSSGDDWGGSINMRSLDERLYTLLNKNLQTYNVTSSAGALATIQTGHGVKTSTGYHWYYSDSHNSFNSFDSGSGTYYSKNPNLNSVVYRLGGSQNVRASTSPTSNTGRPLFPVPQSVLPLLVDAENGYSTLSGNTGYIVGGSTGSGSYGGQTTVRAGSYGLNFIGHSISSSGTGSATYVSSQLEVITNTSTTYNASNFGRIFDTYNSSNSNVSSTMSTAFATRTVDAATLKKYSTAREQLDTVLSGTSYVHGLHFTGSTVSSGDYTTLTTAYINGQTYSNYQLPRHSLDFNLKESGYINFFAGSYRASVGTNSDSFFSLNVVTRSGSNLTGIKEISKIYANTDAATKEAYPHVYLYTDDSYSTGTAGALEFDCQFLWETPSVANALYYFEIPVNSGEYAMGSHSGKVNGTYLIYLDISASGGGETQTVVPGTSIVETQTRTTYNYQYVSGVGVTAVSAPDGVRAETVTSPTASAITKTISVAGMTADNVFILPTTDTVTDSAAVVKYLGKTEVITQRTIMTGTVNDVDTTIIVTKTTTKTYDASDVLISTVNTISATNNGEATETPSGFAASTLVKPATAVSYHFYDPGGITVSFTTDAEIVESAISLTEYSATVTGGSVTVIVDTVPAGKTLNINGTPVSAGNTLTTPAP